MNGGQSWSAGGRTPAGERPSTDPRPPPAPRRAPGRTRPAGLRVAGTPFSMRVSRLGMAMVEEAATGLRPGV
ncbi:hypothetical protein [Streptomyces shenzhenensis]|uniref:hypothetical protein n=1 Tax=Streptomyces shenzhenensis TaxID=943815 RepID=UPI00355933F3